MNAKKHTLVRLASNAYAVVAPGYAIPTGALILGSFRTADDAAAKGYEMMASDALLDSLN